MLLTGPFGGLTDDVREFLRRTTLLRSLGDAGRLTEADAGMLQLTELGREFLDLPAPMSPSPAWFALAGTAPALLAAAAALSGREPRASLAAATAN